MLISKHITFVSAGTCTIDRDLVKRDWDKNCLITRWKDEYRLCRTRYNNVYLKATISKEDALFLINQLGLLEFQSIFKSGSTFKLL